MKKSLKLTTRLLFTFSVLLLSLLIFALGCDDDDPYSSFCEVGKCLEIKNAPLSKDYLKIVDKTNVIINAKGLAADQYPRTDTGMSFASTSFGGFSGKIFEIHRHGAISAIILVNRSHVTKDTVSLYASEDDCKSTGGSADNSLAKRAGGGTCRTYTTGTNKLHYYSYLGTVFDNTDTQKARGIMGCWNLLDTFGPTFDQATTDTTKIRARGYASCSLQIVNNGPDGNSVEIDDNWVDGPGGTATEEVELYITSFDVSKKTIPQFLPASENFDLTKYNEAIDNATFKKLFDHNLGEDLKIKIKIVKSADY